MNFAANILLGFGRQVLHHGVQVAGGNQVLFVQTSLTSRCTWYTWRTSLSCSWILCLVSVHKSKIAGGRHYSPKCLESGVDSTGTDCSGHQGFHNNITQRICNDTTQRFYQAQPLAPIVQAPLHKQLNNQIREQDVYEFLKRTGTFMTSSMSTSSTESGRLVRLVSRGIFVGSQVLQNL